MIDTRNKRASILGLVAAARLVLPLADGSIGQPDRQQVAYCYSGILAEPLSPGGLVCGEVAIAGRISGVPAVAGRIAGMPGIEGRVAGTPAIEEC